MWDKITDKLRKYPAQEKVIRLLFERGFQVSPDGRVVSGGIELAHTQIAKEAGVDRRVVSSTCELILSDTLLRSIFFNITPIPSLRDVAKALGFGVVVISPQDASEGGIIRDVTRVVSSHDVNVQQLHADDPRFVDSAKLTIILDEVVPDGLVEDLLLLDSVNSVSVS
ncbi:MAG: amino acid-binding protein [Methanosarcinales archaeon]|nr:amino acid-binding protein [Methanosarcinales archaeon]